MIDGYNVLINFGIQMDYQMKVLSDMNESYLEPMKTFRILNILRKMSFRRKYSQKRNTFRAQKGNE